MSTDGMNSVLTIDKLALHLQTTVRTQEKLQEYLSALTVEQLSGLCRKFNCGIGELEAVLCRSWHLPDQVEFEDIEDEV